MRAPGVLATVSLAAALALGAAACAATEEIAPSAVPATVVPERTVSPAVGPTRAELIRVLGERRLIVTEPQEPYRPAEAALLAAAPRADFKVQLPEDPGKGWIVVYELADPDAAMAAAQEQATWLGSGPGRVQTPIGTVHVIRVVGSTVILYSWLPDDARDPAAPEIQAGLETIGIGVDVPA